MRGNGRVRDDFVECSDRPWSVCVPAASLVSAGLFLPLCRPELFPAVFSICFVYVGDFHALFGRKFSPAVGLALPSVFQKVTFVTVCTFLSTRHVHVYEVREV